MASILNVDKIRATGSTTDAVTIDSSGNMASPGHVVNYAHLDIRTTTSLTTTNTVTDLNGGSLNYTPKASGNKLIVTGVAHVFLAVDDTSWTAAHIQLVIDGNVQSAAGAATTYGTGIRDTGISGTNIRLMTYAQTIDEYTTTGTSQIVIKLQANRTQSGVTCSFNEYGKGSITVMEIAQ